MTTTLRPPSSSAVPPIMRRSEIIAVSVASLVGGALVALFAWRLTLDGLLTAGTCGALLLPLVASVRRVRHSPGAVVPIVVSLALAFLFLPRLVAFDPDTGLSRVAGLTPAEVSDALRVCQLVLCCFSITMAAVLFLAPVRTVGAAKVPQEAEAQLRATLRLRLALVLGVAGSLATLLVGLSHGISARSFQGGSSPLELVGFFGPPVPAALWLAGRRRLSVLMLVAGMAGPFLQGGRQSVLTPVGLLLLAMVIRHHRLGRPVPSITRMVAVAALLGIAIVGVAVMTTSKREQVDTAVHGGKTPSVLTSLVQDQTLLDSMMVAVEREDRPQNLAIYGRALAAPIPRALWPDKPLSYDYGFRARHFPQYEDAIPISLVGTSFLSFLWIGALLAGMVLAALAVGAERLLGGSGQRTILLGGAVALFALDVLRIGGLYRELLTFAGTVICVLLLTRPLPSSPFPMTSRSSEGAGISNRS